MKSNRIRLFQPAAEGENRVAFRRYELLSQPQPVNLNEMPAPVPIAKPLPNKIVQDILVATLLRLQNHGSAEVAAAAADYLELIRPEL